MGTSKEILPILEDIGGKAKSGTTCSITARFVESTLVEPLQHWLFSGIKFQKQFIAGALFDVCRTPGNRL
jgi:hypothetical protein